jgi:hypothetical protein
VRISIAFCWRKPEVDDLKAQARAPVDAFEAIFGSQTEYTNGGNLFGPEGLVNPEIPEIHIMARFFFHIRRNGVLEMDTDGVEFANYENAHADAVRFVREMIAERIMSDALIDEECVQIASAEGDILSEVRCSSLVKMG